MRSIFFIVVFSFAVCGVWADDMFLEDDVLMPVLDGTHLDDMMVDPEADVDSLYYGSVVIRVDSTAQEALEALSSESSEGVMGYRVGLFFDNSSSARSKAQDVVTLCDSLYGDVVTTLSYANPYFKVSAGYCTTLEEALMLLNRLQRGFPKAFLVSERILPMHLTAVRDQELSHGHLMETTLPTE